MSTAHERKITTAWLQETMQTPNPTAGMTPAVDPSSWNFSPNGAFSPRSADSYTSHDAAVARRRNAQVRYLSLHHRGHLVRLLCCYRRAICATRRKPNANLKGPIQLVSNVCAVTQNACSPQDGRDEKISKGIIDLFPFLFFPLAKKKKKKVKIMEAKKFPRSHYVKELEERVSRTESLLKAAGLLDESSNHDEFTDGEGEQLEKSDSERGRENENDQSSSSWKAKPNRERTRRTASLGQNPGSAPTIPKLNRNSFSSATTNHPASGSERRRSLPGSSNIQHVPVLSFDVREESRYYGLSIPVFLWV